MPAVAKLGKREHPVKSAIRKVLDNLRSQLTWLDLIVGLIASMAISALLGGFQSQEIPDYRIGSIATEDVRARQDAYYEDVEATETRRESARSSVPAVYEVDVSLIARRKDEISKAFEAARQVMAERRIPRKGTGAAKIEPGILRELSARVGGAFSPDILPVFFRHRFDPALESKILKVLDAVLRRGIVADPAQFWKDRKSGITLRDASRPSELTLTDTYQARDVAAAAEQIRLYDLEFASLPSTDRASIIRYLQSLLVPTLLFKEAETNLRRQAAASAVAPVEVHIKRGAIVVRSGEEVTPRIAQQVAALTNARRPRSLLGQFAGFFFFVSIFLYSLWRYFVYYQRRHLKIRNHTVLILVVLFMVLLVMRLLASLADILSERLAIDVFRDPFNLYFAVPLAFGSVLITLLVDVNLGIISSLIVSTLAGLFFGDIHLAAYVLAGSLAGIYSIRQYKDRAAILKAGLTIGAVNVLGLLAINILRQEPLSLRLFSSALGFGMANGILASALASVLLPALESLFKITTDIRLLELSNLNAPILRRLSVEAPGTYHHSLMVGTLSEAAAEAIGANPLLVRVAAYYHDLGKMLKPEYFVENQIYGTNKHESLSPNMSCLILASHVKDGLEMAAEIGLAQKIRDMIPQHHGTRLMTYFYRKAKDAAEAKNQEVDEADFRYPGPKPQSKEAAIMMMADSIEAASRTLSDPTAAQIQGMINRLVDSIIADSQFNECDITMRDVRLVKESFFRVLTGLYHRRIDYPGYDFRQIEDDLGKIPVPNSGPKPAATV